VLTQHVSIDIYINIENIPAAQTTRNASFGLFFWACWWLLLVGKYIHIYLYYKISKAQTTCSRRVVWAVLCAVKNIKIKKNKK
jgi:hypothetical protein